MPRKWVSGERSTSLESMLGDAMPMKAASTSLRERMCHEADMLERHKRENWGKAWVTLDRATEMRACNRNNRPREPDANLADTTIWGRNPGLVRVHSLCP